MLRTTWGQSQVECECSAGFPEQVALTGAGMRPRERLMDGMGISGTLLNEPQRRKQALEDRGHLHCIGRFPEKTGERRRQRQDPHHLTISSKVHPAAPLLCIVLPLKRLGEQ